jgi:hypothetical protein
MRTAELYYLKSPYFWALLGASWIWCLGGDVLVDLSISIRRSFWHLFFKVVGVYASLTKSRRPVRDPEVCQPELVSRGGHVDLVLRIRIARVSTLGFEITATRR